MKYQNLKFNCPCYVYFEYDPSLIVYFKETYYSQLHGIYVAVGIIIETYNDERIDFLKESPGNEYSDWDIKDFMPITNQERIEQLEKIRKILQLAK